MNFGNIMERSLQLRPHSFRDFSGRGIPEITIPSSTFSCSNETEIILFRNKSPKFIQIYHHYSIYSCSSSCSTLWFGIVGIDGILFQFYLFPKNVASIYYSSIPPLPVPKNYKKECSQRLCKI